MPIEPGHYVPGFRVHVLGYTSVFYPVGALLGLLPGIAWAIDQKSARRRFLEGSIAGVVIGFILSMASNRVEPLIVFVVAGMYVGVVLAMKQSGVFEAKDQRSE